MSMASHMSESVEPMRIPHAGLHPMERWGSSEGFGVQCGVGTPRTVRAGLAMCVKPSATVQIEHVGFLFTREEQCY